MQKIKLIPIIIILALVFGLGFIVGHAVAIKLCVKIAIAVLDIEIDPRILQQMIIKYGYNVEEVIKSDVLPPLMEKICT